MSTAPRPPASPHLASAPAELLPADLPPAPPNGKSRIGRWQPASLYCLFVVLGVIYSIQTPAFETPDEIWHFAFIHHVATGQGLPISEADTQALWQQQGVQAPGYYLAAAALSAWIDLSDFPTIFTRSNPHAAIGHPAAIGNRNYLLPYADDGWPWQGTFLALHLVRLFSVALGAITLWASYQTLRLFVAERVAFFGVAVFAFIPQFIFISAAASNDNAVNALAALVLWRVVALAMIPRARPISSAQRRRDFLILGSLLGLAALSKLSALGLVGVAGLAVLVHSWERRDWRILAHAILWIGVPILLIGGWWYARNWLLYADPLAWNIWRANIILRVEPAGWRTIVRGLGTLEQSFWGVFGWLNVAYPDIVYSFFRSLLWMTGFGLIFAAVRWLRRDRQIDRQIDRRFWAGALLLIWLGVLTISWVRFMTIAPAAQGRYFFPAAPTIALFLGLGLRGWRLWTLPWLAVISLFILSALTPWWIIQPAYQPPPAHAAPTPEITPLSVQIGDRFRIAGIHAEPAQLSPGDVATVTVQWESLPPSTAPVTENPVQNKDYSVFVHLVDGDGLTIAQFDTVPGRGLRPTSQWQPGERFTEQYPVRIPPTAYTPSQAQWAVGLYGGDYRPHVGPINGDRLPVQAHAPLPARYSIDTTALRFGAVEVLPPAGEVPNALHAQFADGMELAGYTLSQRVLTPGDPLTVTLYWRSAQIPSQDYTVFVHLLNEALDGVGGQDMPPAVATGQWTPDTLYPHAHTISIPPDLPPGHYRLAVGMYARTPSGSFDRLALLDAGRVLGAQLQAEGADRYLLGPIRVDAAGQ
ncbi:MAG: glycosyltransferase family 39 protein [Litorilinea sp.]